MRILIIICFLFAFSLKADEFYLTDSQGKEYGPFEFRQGRIISIQDKKLTITKIITPIMSQTEKKMKSIIIPEIEFRNANINDVIQFLTDASKDYDNSKERINKSIGLCIIPTPSLTKANNTQNHRKHKDDIFADTFVENIDDSSITLKMKNVSIYKAISTLCKSAELSFAIDEQGVVWIDGKKHIK